MSSAPNILPIDEAIQLRVTKEVERYIDYAQQVFAQQFQTLPVRFDLKGRAAGMYCVKGRLDQLQRYIRFNPWLFAKYPEDSWDNTIPHEVAHYISDCLYGLRTIKPHGKEWKYIMQVFGAEPLVRANYDMTGIPVRQVKRYAYRCQCREVMLTSYRHQKVQQGVQRYQCRDCRGNLVYIQTPDNQQSVTA